MIAYELMRENHMKTYENEILIWESYDLIWDHMQSYATFSTGFVTHFPGLIPLFCTRAILILI